MRIVTRRYGSIAKCWFDVFSRDKDERIALSEFMLLCRHIGFDGNSKVMFEEFDAYGRSSLIVANFDPVMASAFQEFKELCAQRYGSILDAFTSIDPERTGLLHREKLSELCDVIGYVGPIRLSLEPPKSEGGEADETAKVAEEGEKQDELAEKQDELAEKQDEMAAEKQDEAAENPDETQPSVKTKPIKPPSEELYDWLSGATIVESTLLTLEEIDRKAAEIHMRADTTVELMHHGIYMRNDVTRNNLIGSFDTSRTAINVAKQTGRQELRAEIEAKAAKAKELNVAVYDLPGFKSLLIRRFGSLVKAWKEFDRELKGRLVFAELCQSCHQLGFYASKELWSKLDVQQRGFISMYDLDPPMALLLQELTEKISAKCGNLEAAWNHLFDACKGRMCSWPMFQLSCEALDFGKEKAKKVFQALAGHKGIRFIVWDDFDLLSTWFQDDQVDNAGHAVTSVDLSHLTALARKFTDEKVEEADADELRRYAKRRFGSMLTAWMLCLDRHRVGTLGVMAFCRGLREMGFRGNARVIFDELDENSNGTVSLEELDPVCWHLLITFHTCVEEYGGFLKLWEFVERDRKRREIQLSEFQAACDELNYSLSAEKLFQELDIDRSGSLSYDEVLWAAMPKAKATESYIENCGRIQLSGNYKKPNSTCISREKEKARERRLTALSRHAVANQCRERFS